MRDTICHTEPAVVDDRLAALGFPRRVVDTAVRVWAAVMNSGTPFHPRTYPGYAGWAEAVRTLREEGIDVGVTMDFEEGVELSVNAQTGVEVVVCQGNAATGDAQRQPTTKYKRGPKSTEILQAQTSLFGSAAGGRDNGRQVWILLIYQEGDEVRSELSRVCLVNEGHVVKWQERIILPALRVDAPSGLGSADLEPNAEIDVPVTSRD